MATTEPTPPPDLRPGRLLRREIAASVEIDAPMDVVWDTLVDLARYREWNSFTPQVDGVLEVGALVRIRVHMPRRSQSWQTERVNHVDLGRSFSWGLHIGPPWLLCTNRVQELTAVSDGRTRYTTVDRFSGLLVPLVMALYHGPMQTGFDAMARDLRAAVEGARR